jgi:Leucine-rich repeat (LRR) protein
MGTAKVAPTSGDSSAPGLPVRHDWIDVALRLATSWVGLFSAYAVALILALTKFKELIKYFRDVGMPPWLGIALIAAFPLLALVFSTIPAFIQERRIKRYSEIAGAIQTGYFTLRPRENEEAFERADNAHQEVLFWIESTKEPVLYLTGGSGTGKSSLLLAWVIPKLKRENHVVIQLRGYEGDLLARVKEELLRPGLIWDKAPGKTEDFRSLLDRAMQRLGGRQLFIVVDQFEEFLILKDEARQDALRQFVSETPISGLRFLLIYRPEYEGFIEDQLWPKLKLDTNRKVIKPFTENAAQEFMRKSGITVSADLMRAVLREAAEIEQTTGLIRPVTINLCGLVVSRFASGLPRRFRGGLIRGFLRESLLLPEVREVAGKLIPRFITDNVTKRPCTVTDLARATLIAPATVRACLRRLGESDRAIVRPLDQQQETWEISHDFLVPLLDSIVARRMASWWLSFRPWLPWTAAGVMGIAALVVPLMTHQDPTVELRRQGWTVSESDGVLLLRNTNIPPKSVPILRGLNSSFGLDLRTYDRNVSLADVSALRGLKNLTRLNLSVTKVADVSALSELKNLTQLNLNNTKVADVSALSELKNLTQLDLGLTPVADISASGGLKNLTQLDLSFTPVADISALGGLKNLTQLNLGGATIVADVSALSELKNLTQLGLDGTNVGDVSVLRELKNLTQLDLSDTKVADVSALRELKNLTQLSLYRTHVADVSALRELKNLTQLDLSFTKVADVSALRELKNLTQLNLSGTKVADVSALRELKNLTQLNLTDTKVADVSVLGDLKNLTELNLSYTNVADVSALRGLRNLHELNLNQTKVVDISALNELKNLIISHFF